MRTTELFTMGGSYGNKRAYTPKYMAGRDAAKRRRIDTKTDDTPTKKPLNGYQGRKYDPHKAAGNRNSDRLDERDLKRGGRGGRGGGGGRGAGRSSGGRGGGKPAAGKKRTQRK